MTSEDYGTFIADYASLLWGCGATCIRTEKNVSRISAALGIDAAVEIMPRHVHVILGDGTVIVRKMTHTGINFDINTRLSRLSWDLADSKISFDEMRRQFADISATAPTNRWEVLGLTSVANAAFCAIFGGDIVAMVLVMIATALGFRLKQMMLSAGRDARLTCLCAAFFSATFSAAGHIFGLGATPEIAVGTSVLYLIPGVPYINSVSDVIGRHYLCAMSRFLDALILTCCLSAGLASGLCILGLKWF